MKKYFLFSLLVTLFQSSILAEEYMFVASEWCPGAPERISASNVVIDELANTITISQTGIKNVSLNFKTDKVYYVTKPVKYFIIKGVGLSTKEGHSSLWWLNGRNNGGEFNPTAIETDNNGLTTFVWEIDTNPFFSSGFNKEGMTYLDGTGNNSFGWTTCFGLTLAEQLSPAVITYIGYESDIQGVTYNLTVTNEYRANLTDKVSITWYDANGKEIGTGKSLNGIEEGAELYYSIELDEELGRVYREVKMRKVVVEGETVICQLERIKELALHGKVVSETTEIADADISLTQWLNGKYEYTANAKTDENGEFTLKAYSDTTLLTISAKGYLDKTMNYRMLNTSELGTIELEQAKGMVITMALSYQEAVREGQEPVVQDWYSDTRNIAYTVRNVSKGMDINDFAMQYGDIVLPFGSEPGDSILVTLRSLNGKFATASGGGTIGADGTADIAVRLVAYGGVEAVMEQRTDEQSLVMLYGDDGKLVVSSTTSSSRITFTGLEAGDYILVAMGYNGSVGSIGDLTGLEAFGLVEGSDYVKTAVTVRDGIIGSVTISEVPELDASKFEYTSLNTSYLPNKTEIAVDGSFVTLTARVDFKTQYADEVNGVKLIVGIPEGCEFIANSVVTGMKALPHTVNGNQLTITLDEEDIDSRIRFCMMPKQTGTFTSTAYAEFDCRGQKSQSIGTAVFEATAGSISVPSLTASKSVTVGGIAAPHATVDIYDDDQLIGSTIALGDAKWKANVELYKPYNLSTHAISAKYHTESGLSATTESHECVYDMSQVKAKSVTMSFYNGWLKKNVEVTFDFETGTTSSNNYMFYTATDFTFVADLTANDTTSVRGVTFYVHTTTKDVRQLEGFFDNTLGRWVAVSRFDSNNLPVNLGIEVTTILAEKEILADRQIIEDGELMIEDGFQNRKEDIQKFSDILTTEDVELEDGYLYEELELLLSDSDYDEAKALSIINLILSNIPDSDVELTDEAIEQMETTFDNDQRTFEEWFTERTTTGREELFEAALKNINYLNAELPSIPYSGSKSVNGTFYEYSADWIQSVNEDDLISKGYVLINMTDGSKMLCRVTDSSFSFIDEKSMSIHTFTFTDASEVRSIMKEPLTGNFKQAFQNIFQNLRNGASYSRNYNDWLNLSVTISQLFGLLENTYATIFDVVEGRINEAFRVDELDREIEKATQERDAWARYLRGKYKGNTVVRMRDFVYQKQLGLNLSRLKREREAILKAYNMAIIPLRQYPRRISQNVARMNNVVRSVGRVAGAFSVFIDIIDLTADVRDLNDEIKGWAIARMAAENKRPCENDNEKLQNIINTMQTDFVDMLGAYGSVILGKVATTALDIAQIPAINPTSANPLVELGLYVGSVYTGLVTEVYKVVRIDNGEFINRKTKHWTAIHSLKCKKKSEEEEEELESEEEEEDDDDFSDGSPTGVEPSLDYITPPH